MDIKLTDRLILLMDEISVAKSKLQPTDTGHIHTSISYLESRVSEVKQQLEQQVIQPVHSLD